jgi:hypothetical protein
LKGGGEIFLPNDRCLFSGDFHVGFHSGLERREGIMLGLFFGGVKFVKGRRLENMCNLLTDNIKKPLFPR